MEIGFHLTLTGHSVNWRFVVKKSRPPERRAMIVNLRGLSTPSWPETLVRIIREGAESGVWGDEIAPKMIVAA
jgi:hypothetical protein